MSAALPGYPFVSSMGRRGQVTVPLPIRQLLGLGPHDRVAFLIHDGHVEIVPAESVTDRTAGALASAIPALSPAEERAAIEEAWAEELLGSER
jgi:AbrB family looped-hinge helix DNA binding protein